MDSAGGLVFTSSDKPPELRPEALSVITSADVEAQMERSWLSSDAWWDEPGHSRFSLAGSQSKFSVTVLDGVWYWPSASFPSTHIINGIETPIIR